MVGSISISGVSKHFVNPTGERITALDNVSLDIPAGSFVSLIGPSGCGKSTLLRLISGLIPMDDGSLTLDGTPIKAPGADRGFMFQEHTLFPWLSIYDNIAFGLRPVASTRGKGRVDEFIEMVGLKGFGAFVSAPAFRRHVPARVSRKSTRWQAQGAPAR
ncbi:MAG: ATP-binding cassette domain-containing protein [Butyricicoccus sp.]